jgi:hypothetical protein
MVKKSQWIWYLTNTKVRAAFFYNCRKRDLWDGSGIDKGTIIEGANGFVVAEAAVPDVSGKAVAFQPNRRCEWQGMELACMVKAGALAGQPAPREFNYIVARLSTLEAEQLAARHKLPTVQTPGGEVLANLEIARFATQGKNRLATLL